jgi:protein SCO1/2
MNNSRIWLSLAALVGASACLPGMAAKAQDAKQHSAHGIVLYVDASPRSIEVSCDEIPDYMAAMDMSFQLRDVKDAAALQPGKTIRFTIVPHGKLLYAQDIHVETAAVFEPDPMEAGGLSALNKALNPALSAKALNVGQPVPDFTLTDQAGSAVRLSQLKGKVVALTFGYSRCPNPDYCYRLSNNLAQVRRQLHEHAGKDLVLLTIAIDPEHDHGEVLAQYAAAFHADPQTWHFLTGPEPEIHRIAALFGMNFWASDGLLTHSLHTVVLDREGRLAANLEGNQFTPKQLADLVRSVMDRPRQLARN